MKNTYQHQSPTQTAKSKLRECWWMQGGVVDYKLCDRDYDCEHCPFDEALHGGVTTSACNSDGSSSTESFPRGWTARVPNNSKNTSVQGCEVVGSVFYHTAHT